MEMICHLESMSDSALDYRPDSHLSMSLMDGAIQRNADDVVILCDGPWLRMWNMNRLAAITPNEDQGHVLYHLLNLFPFNRLMILICRLPQ